jgi:hypothetical protein
MGGTKCLRLGTCELEDMGGVLQRNSSITVSPEIMDHVYLYQILYSHSYTCVWRGKDVAKTRHDDVNASPRHPPVLGARSCLDSPAGAPLPRARSISRARVAISRTATPELVLV